LTTINTVALMTWLIGARSFSGSYGIL